MKKEMLEKQPYSQESWTATWIKRKESDAVWAVVGVTDIGVYVHHIWGVIPWIELMEEWELSPSIHGPFHPCYR